MNVESAIVWYNIRQGEDYVFDIFTRKFSRIDGAISSMEREKKIIQTSVVGIIGNVLLVTAKAIIGLIAGSISIILDAINN